MRGVAPGDVVFSFADPLIRAIGIVDSHAYEAPKSLECGQAGAYWEMIGWHVDVRFVQLRHSMRPSEYMSTLAPLLPRRYSPLLPNGKGLQSVCLTHLAETLAAALVDLIGVDAREVVVGRRMTEEAPLHAGIGLLMWEEHEMDQLRASAARLTFCRESS